MTRVGTRWVGTSMTAGAVLALLVAHGIMKPEPVAASECCQACEAKEAACYSVCANMSHNEGGGDSLQACYDTCDYELYYAPYGCWANCTYCQPPEPRCFTFVNWHIPVEPCVWRDPVFWYICYQWTIRHELSSWEHGC